MKETKQQLCDYLQPNETASAMDCTGLIPAQPENEIEADAYSELYPIPKQHMEKEVETGRETKNLA